MRVQSRLSREFFDAEVTARSADGVQLDPATLPVEFAFVAIGAEPTDSDWHAATHQHDDVFSVLVGPGALVLPADDYDVWQHIVDSPEEPRAPFGKLRIY